MKNDRTQLQIVQRIKATNDEQICSNLGDTVSPFNKGRTRDLTER